MCWVVYIGAARKLPLVQSERLRVKAATDPPERVVRTLQSPFVYEVASYDGCGCGFQYESAAEHSATIESLRDAPPEQRELETLDRTRRVESVDALRAYLKEKTTGGTVLVYASWYLDDAPEPSIPAAVNPSVFGGDSFEFTGKSLWRVSL